MQQYMGNGGQYSGDDGESEMSMSLLLPQTLHRVSYEDMVYNIEAFAILCALLSSMLHSERKGVR